MFLFDCSLLERAFFGERPNPHTHRLSMIVALSPSNGRHLEAGIGGKGKLSRQCTNLGRAGGQSRTARRRRQSERG